ncbi:MAG TPA: HAMP domain-containing sensor histidine kinase [Bacilli bacterium]
MRRNGIFVKTFLYTTVFAVLLVGVTAFLFSAQIISYYRTQNVNHIARSYQRIVTGTYDGTDIVESAKRFYEKNQSLPFVIRDKEGNTIFATPDTNLFGDETDRNTAPGVGAPPPYTVYRGAEYDILVPGDSLIYVYKSLTKRVIVIVIAVLAISMLAAYIYARQILKLKYDIEREQQLTETQRYFFSAVSHELKTPIAATSVLLEGMLANIGDYKDHPKYMRECLKLIDSQNEMISEILEIVSLSEGKIIPAIEKLNIGQIVADILQNYQALAEADGLRIITNIPSGVTALADYNMLKRALSNVVLNAVQNTPSGGEIRIWCEMVSDKYRLSVLNTGVKIADDVLPKLFEPFYRVDKARSRKSGHSGLGLTIVQKTLEAMGIPFALENARDGVQFWIDLPQASTERIQIGTP